MGRWRWTPTSCSTRGVWTLVSMRAEPVSFSSSKICGTKSGGRTCQVRGRSWRAQFPGRAAAVPGHDHRRDRRNADSRASDGDGWLRSNACTAATRRRRPRSEWESSPPGPDRGFDACMAVGDCVLLDGGDGRSRSGWGSYANRQKCADHTVTQGPYTHLCSRMDSTHKNPTDLWD